MQKKIRLEISEGVLGNSFFASVCLVAGIRDLDPFGKKLPNSLATVKESRLTERSYGVHSMDFKEGYP